MTVTKTNRDGVSFKVGDVVKIFGTKIATIVSVHRKGRTVGYSVGDTIKYTSVGNLKLVTS